MKVLHVCPYMHPAAGGPPVVVEQLCAHQAKVGWASSVISTSLYCGDDGRALQGDLSRMIDATILPCEKFRYWGGASRVRETLGKGVKDADIVHLHTLWHPFNGLARSLCAKFQRPYVLMPHGMLDPYALGVRAWRKRAYLAIVEGRNLRQAERLIFTSPIEDRLARQMLPWLGPADVIPLGADPPSSLDRTAALQLFRERFPQTAGRRLVIHLGRIHPKKGIERVLAVLPSLIAKHPDILFIIAGSGDAQYVEGLREIVRQASLEGYVMFSGLLLGDVKWGALLASELFVLPSHQENFAIAVGEAMHMGLPVVISDQVNIHPLITDAGAGSVVAAGSMPDALGAALGAILGNPNDRRNMGQRARKYAEAAFVWKSAARATIATYESVLSGKMAIEARETSAAGVTS